MWMIVWAALGGIFLLMGVHPFITYPISLIFFTKRGPAIGAEGKGHVRSVTVCTCAYNEAGVIQAKIDNLLRLKERYPGLMVSIYVDGATDGTADVVARYAHILNVDISNDRNGKTHGMNRLVAASQSELVVFTDANVLLADDAIERLTHHFEDEAVGCVCGNLIYTNADDSVTAATGSLYWKLEQFIKSRESLIGSVMGADGSIFAIRRTLHRPPPDDIIDDMFVSFQVLCAGYKIVQVDDVKAYEKSVTAASEEFRRKVRIACQAFNVHRLIWPDLCANFGPTRMYMYISHKLMRWFSIYLLGLGCGCIVIALAAAHLAVFAASICGLGAALACIGSRWHVPLLSSVVDVLTSLLGAGAGVASSILGERYQTWQPASSVRKAV